MGDLVRIEDAGGVRLVTLNRPERRNALTPEMQDDLIAAFRAAGEDTSCRALVLAGAGEAFCAGLDLAHLQEMVGQSKEQHRADAERVARMFHALYALPKPTIAMVNGAAVAGGTGLATICDFTLATPGTKLGYTEVKVGFVPAMVAAYLALQLGEKRARDLLLTGRLFLAEEAMKWGLVTDVIPADELEARVAQLASRLCANSPQAMRATKALLVEQNRAWLDAAIAASMAANAEARETSDFAEGIAAFLEKRKPAW